MEFGCRVHTLTYYTIVSLCCLGTQKMYVPQSLLGKKNYLRTYYSKLKKKFRKQWHWPGVERFQDLSSTACLENQNRKSDRKFYCTNCMIKTQKFLTVKWWHKFSFQEKSKAIENSILNHFLEWNKRECLEHSHSKGTDLITQTLLSTWTQSHYLLLQSIVTYSIL